MEAMDEGCTKGEATKEGVEEDKGNEGAGEVVAVSQSAQSKEQADEQRKVRGQGSVIPLRGIIDVCFMYAFHSIRCCHFPHP